MADLRMHRVLPDVPLGDSTLEDWRHVHNVTIPAHLLSPDEVRERAGRNHLEVAYLGDTLVGNSTVRPPVDGSMTATVIARVPAEYRGRGFGTELYIRALERARALGAEVIETVVLAANGTGLRFARKHGFVEFDRYVLPGESAEWVDLRLAGLSS